jgi:hypothetical protein
MAGGLTAGESLFGVGLAMLRGAGLQPLDPMLPGGVMDMLTITALAVSCLLVVRTALSAK